METAANTKFSFGNFEIDTHRRLLFKNGEIINLNPKTFDLLLALIEREGEIISKNELLDRVWVDQFVEENNLTVHVAALRKILGEKKGEHRYIVTNPGRGYTFVAKIQGVEFEKQKADKNYEKPLAEISCAESNFSNANQITAQLNENAAALDEKAFAAVFEQESMLDLSEAAALNKWQPQTENAVGNQTNNDNQSAEIVIESHTFSRVLIEEEVVEEDENELLVEKTINPRPKLKQSQSQKSLSNTSFYILFLIPGAILITVLTGILFWRSGQSDEGKQFSAAKLTSSGKVSNATLTPDGKYAVYSQTETDGESLWLRHIPTNSQQEILPSKPVKYVGLAVSPDGNSIYATTFSANVADPQIWRVPLLGGAIEEIKGITTGAAVSFSPAGDKIAFTESRSSIRETHLLIADADGANKRILARAADDKRSFPNFGVNPVAWSPGGNEIACAVEEKNGGTKAAILLINPTNGSERFISEKRWDYIEHLAWIDEENLAFIAYTSEPWQGQVWSISRVTGEARQITKDLNSYAWLASAGGNLLTVQKNAVSHISIGDFDEENKQIQPREIFKESGFIDNAAFAADGAILYTSSESGKREIWRMNADGTNRAQLTVNANVTFGISVSPVDGSLVFCSTDDGKHFLKLSNADGKNVRSLTEGAEDVYPNFTADGQTIIFQKGLDNKLITLWSISVTDKIPVQITETHSTHPAISPDGTQTAYYFMDADTDGLWRVGLVSIENGSYMGKLSFPKAVTERRMRWHPNGKFIGQILYEGENINLLLLPTGGGDAQIVSGLGKGDVNWFEWSPNGKQIVVSHATETQDIVLLSK